MLCPTKKRKKDSKWMNLMKIILSTSKILMLTFKY